MECMPSKWRFDENVAPIFDEHVKKSVPLYENMHDLISEISHWFIEDDTNVYDLGTSTGETIVNLSKRHKDKDVQYIGVDNSIDMISKARERVSDQKNINLFCEDVTKDNFKIENASYIVSMLTIQFIQQEKRERLLNKIYRGMNRGSGFVLVEKIIGNNARFDEMWIELYHDLKIKNGLTEKEVFNKSRSIRGVLKPYTVNENLEMLKRAGFNDVDMFLKWNNFAGFIAIK